MFFWKKAPPEIYVDVSGCSLRINCFVRNIRVAKIFCVIRSETTIYIGDITFDSPKYYNKGYGSLMMTELIKYAKENGYSLLTGQLSEVDLGHKDRLHHFYNKFGFTITEFPKSQGCYYGCIEKKL